MQELGGGHPGVEGGSGVWEEQAMEEERVEREAQVVAGDTLPLEGGLTGALTCPYCRVS